MTSAGTHLLRRAPRPSWLGSGCLPLCGSTHDTGFLQGRGTSCAHTVWLDDEEIALMAKDGATAVHNPLSNVRLGSGVMPVKRFVDAGVFVAMGCDGSCSSDGQDMLEAL